MNYDLCREKYTSDRLCWDSGPTITVKYQIQAVKHNWKMWETDLEWPWKVKLDKKLVQWSNIWKKLKLLETQTWVVLHTFRKSYMGFHFVPWTKTFDDLERSNSQKIISIIYILKNNLLKVLGMLTVVSSLITNLSRSHNKLFANTAALHFIAL